MNHRSPNTLNKKGFTLVELVVVIVIVGIMSALGGMIITNHMEGYGDMRRRAELVDSAESALRRMQRDIRGALPNSVETFRSQEAVSFLHTSAGGRYRAQPPGNVLQFDQQDNSTDIIGRLYTTNETITNSSLCVYNTGQHPANAYNGTNISPITHVSNSSDRLEFNDIDFPYSSPYQRFFVVDSQVCYVYDGNDLIRYERNSTDIIAPGDCTSSGWESEALVARHVNDADFTYHPGTPSRSGLMTLELTLEEEGEQVSLLHQVHVLNFP